MRLFRGHFAALVEIGALLTRNRELTYEMARREITDRYAGQTLGAVWAVAHPLFLMALYVFIFAYVFKTKIGGSYELPLDYTAYILSGLIPWMSFQEAMTKGAISVTSNAQLVKQVVFPLEVLPVKGVLAALFTHLVSIGLFAVYVLLTAGRIHFMYLLLPVLILLQAVAMFGMSYVLAAVGVYFRDLKDLVQLFAIAGMYLVPVFYLPDWVPAIFKPVLYLNPFSYLIWCYQDVLYFGRFEHPYAWGVVIAFSFGGLAIGYRVFKKLKPAFGNVL